jgi:MFS family permease
MTKILKIVAFMALLHCGFTSSRVISTLYALNYGQPAWTVGVILSTYAAIPALISIHVGKFIDKIGVRIPITVSFLMISAACLMPILFPYEKFGFWPIIVTSLLAGTGFVFTLISGQGLIGHLSNNKNRATAFTYQSIAFSISGSTGPVVAGYLITEVTIGRSEERSPLHFSAAESFCSRRGDCRQLLTNLRQRISGITVPLNYSKM